MTHFPKDNEAMKTQQASLSLSARTTNLGMSGNSLDEQLRALISQFGVKAVQQSLDNVSSAEIPLIKDDRDDTQNHVLAESSDEEDSSSNNNLIITENFATTRVDRLVDSILQSGDDGAVVADTEKGTLTQANMKAMSMFAYESKEALIGVNVDALVSCTGDDGTIKSVLKWKSDESKQQWTAKRADGTEFQCRVGVHSIPGSTAVLALIRDITDEVKAEQLSIQKRAAEELLLNMLPSEIAQRLQTDPTHIADHFPHASILFADIVGFTRMSNSLAPIEVVHFLNSIFSRFDEKLDKYGLNKVKTIGDCYMVTSIPTLTSAQESCSAVCHFAMDMVRAIQEYNQENPDAQLNMRIGVNTGPVVAGVVGTKRFLYDVWGDAVNVASRMESTGVPGKVQVTKAVVDLIEAEGSDFTFEKRGMVNVKGIGEMETYFVKEHNRKRAIRYWKSLRTSFMEDKAQKSMDIFELLTLMSKNR